MPIYTKGGDKGSTSLYDGQRVSKDSLQVDVYGTFDELNANVSLADKFCQNPENVKLLRWVEYHMFFLQGELASQHATTFQANSRLITAEDVQFLEQAIDDKTAQLPKIDQFILPGSSTAGAQLHVCRTVCRRAERLLVGFMKDHPVRPELERYVNRLSDFFYIIARSEDDEQRLQAIVAQVSKRYLEAVREGDQ